MKKEEQIQLEADERILMRVRKHWFIVGVEMFSVVVAALFPLVAYGALIYLGMDAPAVDASVLTVFYAGWLLIMWMAFWSVWTNYYLDVWTVTNKRLIAVDQRGFFSRTTASFRFERIQDIIVSVNGIVATLLGYGSIEVQTAGDENNFTARGLPNPAEIKSTILSSADALMKQSGSGTTGTV